MINHHNYDYDGGAPNIPLAIGDRYYAQDLARDFWYMLNESSNVKELFDSFPVLLDDGSISQGTDFQKIDLGIIRGFVEYNVTIPADFSSIPPTDTTEDIILFVESTAQTDLDISATATLDGASTNYVKLRYVETNGSSRARAKKAGSYNYEKVKSFSIIVDTTAPTDYDIVIGTIVGDGSSFMTIVNYEKTSMIDYSSRTELLTASKDFVADNLNRKILVDSTAADITIGLFNGAGKDGVRYDISVISGGNSALIELVTNGVTNYTLKAGEDLTVIWDATNSAWVIKELYTKVRAISTDLTIPDGFREITYLVTTTDLLKRTITLPDATTNKGVIIKILKASDTYAPVVIETNGTQTINNWNYTINSVAYQLVPIFFQNECCELVSDGTNWNIINGYVPIYDTGLVYTSSANLSNQVKFGIQKITIGSVSGTFELFEVVEGQTNNEKGIVCDLSATTLTLLQTVPYNKTTGLTSSFSAAESVVGQSSSASGSYSSYTTETEIPYPFYNNNSYVLYATTSKNLYKSITYTMELISDTSWTEARDNFIVQKGTLTQGASSFEAGQIIKHDRAVTGNLLNIYGETADDGAAVVFTNNGQVGFETGHIWFRFTIKG